VRATRSCVRKPHLTHESGAGLRSRESFAVVRSLPPMLAMSTTTRYAAVVLLAGLLSSCNSSTTPAGPTPSPGPTQTQAPAANPVPAPEPEPSPPTTTYTYSGIVTDGQGRPVTGVTVRGGPDSGTTDANGRYEFRSQYDSVPGNLYPPAGYERKPVRWTDSFVLTPGQNLTVRRITGLTAIPPATLAVGARTSVNTQVMFDTGAIETPVLEVIELISSDPSILRAGAGSAENDRISIAGVAPGTASVTARYFGVSSPARPVQVVPR